MFGQVAAIATKLGFRMSYVTVDYSGVYYYVFKVIYCTIGRKYYKLKSVLIKYKFLLTQVFLEPFIEIALQSNNFQASCLRLFLPNGWIILFLAQIGVVHVDSWKFPYNVVMFYSTIFGVQSSFFVIAKYSGKTKYFVLQEGPKSINETKKSSSCRSSNDSENATGSIGWWCHSTFLAS